MGAAGTQQEGILAIWNDCAPGAQANYEHWYLHEHLYERVRISGFRSGRRYEASEGKPKYFTYYETESPDVLNSEAYLERVNNPSELTRRIMSGTFLNVNRTVCRRASLTGRMRGSVAVTARFSRSGESNAFNAVLARMADFPGFVRGETWLTVDRRVRPATAEEALRGEDERIGACLIVETTREVEAQTVAHELRTRLSGTADVGIYRFLCSLVREDLGP